VHSPTLLILLAILLGIMALTQVASWYLSRRVPAQVFWAGAYGCAFLSAINMLVREYQPDLVLILSVQISQFLTAYLMLMGARSYMGLSTWPLRYGVAAIFGIVAFSLFFTLIEPYPALRVIMSSLVVGSLFALCAITIAQGDIRRYPARYLFALPCGIHAVFVLLRLAHIYQTEGFAGDLVRGSTIPPLLLLEAVIALVMMAFATLMLVSETITSDLRKLAETDHLTNTFNRRSFLKLFEGAVSAANRRQSPLSVLLIDLDHFKRINDTYGHGVGDNVLRHFVAIAASCLRAEDILGRIGGEEFSALLPDVGPDDAQLIAERLRIRIAELAFNGPQGPIHLTVSIGIAQCLPSEPPEKALHRADAAMYRAKESGRNRVETWIETLQLSGVA